MNICHWQLMSGSILLPSYHLCRKHSLTSLLPGLHSTELQKPKQGNVLSILNCTRMVLRAVGPFSQHCLTMQDYPSLDLSQSQGAELQLRKQRAATLVCSRLSIIMYHMSVPPLLPPKSVREWISAESRSGMQAQCRHSCGTDDRAPDQVNNNTSWFVFGESGSEYFKT